MKDIFDIISEAVGEIEESVDTAKSLLDKVDTGADRSDKEGVFQRPEFMRNNLIHPQVFSSPADARRADLSTDGGREFATATSYIDFTFGGR